MRTLVAATDFSGSSIHAAHYAADMAGAIMADLVLFSAVPAPLPISEIPVPEAILSDMMSEAGRKLDDLKAELAARTNGKVDISTVILMGHFAEKIGQISKKYNPFAIVMGIPAGKSIGRFLSGSNTFSVIDKNPDPVLIIPEKSGFRSIAKIGLACDLEAVADTVPFKLLNDWLSVFNSSLDIIHVSRNEKDLQASEMSESLALQNHLKKFHPVFAFLTGDNLTERLNNYGKEHKLDLLIVVPKHHSFAGLFSKKFSREIMVQPEVPVLAIHV